MLIADYSHTKTSKWNLCSQGQQNKATLTSSFQGEDRAPLPPCIPAVQPFPHGARLLCVSNPRHRRNIDDSRPFSQALFPSLRHSLDIFPLQPQPLPQTMAMAPFLCARCTRALRQPSLALTLPPTRQLSHSLRLSRPTAPSQPDAQSHDTSPKHPPLRPPDPEKGPMARRLEEATDEALLSGGRAGRRAIEDAGFSEELKARLLNKLADARFNAEHSALLAEAGLAAEIPDVAGEGTRRIATSQPWTGEEATEDTVLRMLSDARKPLAPGQRGKPVIPSPVMDMRLRREQAVSAGHRAASARDKAQAYAGMGIKEVGLSEKERESMKREFRERFQPAARAMPNTMTGLAALANERWALPG